MRRIWNLAPLVVVALALLLSAGVVKIMEVPRKPALEARPPAARPAPAARIPTGSLMSPDTQPEMPAMLSTSILDAEISARPRQSHEVDDSLQWLPAPEDSFELPHSPALELQEPPETEAEPLTAVPEPRSALLLGAGLCWLGATRRRRSARRRR